MLLRQTGGALVRVERDGSGTQQILPTGVSGSNLSTLAWSPDGQILFDSPDRNVMVSRLPLGNTAPRALLEAGGRPWHFANFLPDGRSIVVGHGAVWDSEIVIASMDGSREPTVVGKGFRATWVPPGFVVAAEGARLAVWKLNGAAALSGAGVALTHLGHFGP